MSDRELHPLGQAITPGITTSMSEGGAAAGAGERERILAEVARAVCERCAAGDKPSENWWHGGWPCYAAAVWQLMVPPAATPGETREGADDAALDFIRRWAPPTSDASRDEWLIHFWELLGSERARPTGATREGAPNLERESFMEIYEHNKARGLRARPTGAGEPIGPSDDAFWPVVVHPAGVGEHVYFSDEVGEYVRPTGAGEGDDSREPKDALKAIRRLQAETFGVAPAPGSRSCACACCAEATERHRTDREVVGSCNCRDYGASEWCDCPFCLLSRAAAGPRPPEGGATALAIVERIMDEANVDDFDPEWTPFTAYRLACERISEALRASVGAAGGGTTEREATLREVIQALESAAKARADKYVVGDPDSVDRAAYSASGMLQAVGVVKALSVGAAAAPEPSREAISAGIRALDRTSSFQDALIAAYKVDFGAPRADP